MNADLLRQGSAAPAPDRAVRPVGSSAAKHRCGGKTLRSAVILLAALLSAFSLQAAIQFDVFLGYDGIVPEASWFPVVCEIKNDGAPFVGTVEIIGVQLNQGQTRRMVVELPTGTLKRLVIPVFAATQASLRGSGGWEARLLDERGKLRAEQPNLVPRKSQSRGSPLLGAIPRTASGTPVMRPILPESRELQPATARLLPAILPDNPLALEGLTCLYLNSERAADLSVSQVRAILTWLSAGGHLVIGVEQPSDVNSSPWLKGLVPGEIKELRTIRPHPELQGWLQSATWATNYYAEERPPNAPARLGNQYRPRVASREPSELNPSNPFSQLPNDFDFETADLQIAGIEPREGEIAVASAGVPLVLTTHRGRGRVTTLLFSPEREPMRSWKNLPTFWAKVAEVPGAWYESSDFSPRGGFSSDGIFGAMIDTRQVHKLPIEWLLLLLVVYLVVIGPLDQYWLKRIGKPMLTWITFPCYVVVFSLVIYFIGYRLRSGESEWNELHVVDVLINGDHADLRGRTYSSIYSPANQRYAVEGRQKYATLRGEFQGFWAGDQSSEKATIVQDGDRFKGELFVPVWTSLLFVSDWWEPASIPLSAAVRGRGDSWQVECQNRTDKPLTNLLLVVEDQLFNLGNLEPSQSRTFTLPRAGAVPLSTYLATHGADFDNKVQSRQNVFGETERARLDDLPNSAVAASFVSKLASHRGFMQGSFIAPPGLDLSGVTAHGGAVLLAWAGDYSPIQPMYRFTPRRSHRDTLWRLALPVQ